ncbi:MAG: aminotransferase class V-fold PLP-dependent enzyme [bacterium]
MTRREVLNCMGAVSAGVLLGHPVLGRLEAATRRMAGMTPLESAGEEIFWREVQQSFSVSHSVINLNNAGVCACPKIVTDAVKDLTMEQEKVPPHTAFTTLPPRLETIRTALAKLSGCDAEEIAIVRNTTEALQAILLGVPLERGDEVLTTEHDYWAMLDALEQRRLRDGIVVKKVPVPAPPARLDELVGIFERGITPKTKLILLSHIVNLTGQIFPVKQICEMARTRGIEVAVDAAQSFGMIDFNIDDLGCDYFGTSLHKWLMAPKGTGMLYVRRDKIERTWPHLPPPKAFYADIRKFEALGTIPSIPLAIGEAIAFHNGIGGKRKEARLRFLTHYWVDRLSKLPGVRFRTAFEPEMSCAIANVAIEGVDPQALLDHLWEKHRILLANPTKRAKNVRGVRVSPGLHTTLEELDTFCEVMEGIARKGLRS